MVRIEKLTDLLGDRDQDNAAIAADESAKRAVIGAHGESVKAANIEEAVELP